MDAKTNGLPVPPALPNIVYFLVDDMGYGDVSCLNSEGKIKTPHFDSLARDGMIFTDAHSSSAVCSPSRYSILTGRYNWRSSLQKGIVNVFGDPLIDPDRTTVAKFLSSYGYRTGCIGKWHLGMGWPFPADQDMVPPWKYDSSGAQSTPLPPVDDALRAKWREAFSRPVFGGPRAAGFDYYFGVDVPNWPPYCFIENDTPTGIPSGWLPLGMLGNNQGSLQGPAMEGWTFEQLLPTFAAKADEFIRQCSAGGDARPDGDARADGNVRADGSVPFFLYLPMTSPHTPLAVNAPFKGASGLNNLYADLVIETDDIFGRIMASLRKYGLEDNTLVCFASDNGCAHYIGAKELEAQGHFPSGAYRGYKSDAWDGGHRIPFIVKWPGRIRPGSRSGALVCLSDLFATCVDILGEGAAAAGAGAAGPAHGTAAGITAGGPVVSEDSVSLLPLFKFSGAAAQVRDCVVHHSIAGKFAIRDRQWKLVLCPGSGGWTKNDAEAFKEGLPLAQLYDMDADPGEARNLAKEQPDRVRAMVRRLQSIVDDGRSTPGPQSANDVQVDIWKLDTLPGADASILDDY